VLKLEGVRCYYGAIEALKGVDLEVPQGKIVTLIGSNGAGKTTTLMAICGLRPLASGRILFEGEDLAGLPTEAIVARGIVQVPEGRRIFTRMSVRENLQMGAFLRKDGGVSGDLDHVLGLFPLLRERLKQNAGTLSGGEQQMLAIARALMARPRLLLLDEPSLGLAPALVKAIFDILKAIHDRDGVTLLLVEQNVHRALKIADYGYVLATGSIALHDIPERLLQNEEVKRAYLGDE
jgi:branched-chain amino acid transport system ATP-binding protein